MNRCKWSIHAGALVTMTVITVIAALVAGSGLAQAQDNKWGFGTDVGFQSGTVDGTVFSLGFNLDYYLDPAFSFGPMLLLAPTGDLTQIAIAGVARYHYRMRSVNIVPFAGLGLVHADLDRRSGPSRIDRNDTSHFIPLGVTLEYQLAPKLALATTFMFNLHNLNLSPEVQRDTNSVALMFGMRFGP
ncbi:MAG: outer membrane beta-barrel protein [Nitrospirae bacterium]|nr:outer membrane beta-barrel protein [Nitrospirota bacterium]